MEVDDEFTRPIRKVGFSTAMGFLGAALIAAGLIAADTTHDGVRNVALGVIGSLLASIVFATLSEYSDTPQSRITEALRRSLRSVRAIELETRERLQAGVISVSDKREHNPDYWFSILAKATDRLDIVGNSLSGWVQGEFRARLKSAVARILRDGGQVRIVFMDPDGLVAKVKTQLLGKDYAGHIRDFVSLLGELMDEYKESFEGGQLDIQLAKDDLTYMMIDTGGAIFVSPYMAVTRAGHPLVVEINGTSGFAEGYRADFEKLFARARKADTPRDIK
uniref:hypothetical protein n=1 Tax=uncultured Sphingomonas sp. TaxID=158754 RepID=UPI0035C98AD1